MKTKLIAALLVAVSAAVAAPAFASGYGPAPFYRPSAGAPVSQRGQSAVAIAAERNSTDNAAVDTSYGGVASSSSQSGSRDTFATNSNLFRGH
ncbi:hypothetical protein P3T40_003802 [Paraburkholderia sp. EB58]|jgi:hypothetical protein|uniref:hypothetical protein n=1 Tax=Paraburkholderia sp. EB58 TaxID=3035125 RepID=UPI003D1CA2A0